MGHELYLNLSYFSVIGRQRKLAAWENQMVLDVTRTNAERGYFGDGGEGRELEKKKTPAMFDFFPPLMSLFPHNGKKSSLNLREEE